jgi:predicted nuclease with TOPRIM domain
MAKLKEQLSDKSGLIHSLKQDIGVFEQQQLNMKDQLKELSLDKSMLESELKIARSEISRLKKDTEVCLLTQVIFP